MVARLREEDAVVGVVRQIFVGEEEPVEPTAVGLVRVPQDGERFRRSVLLRVEFGSVQRCLLGMSRGPPLPSAADLCELCGCYLICITWTADATATLLVNRQNAYQPSSPVGRFAVAADITSGV